MAFDLSFDDSTELDAPDLSTYAQIDDDPIGAQPDTIFGAFDFIEDASIFDDEQSFYYRQDDDVVVVTPPTGSGGAAGKTYVISGGKDKGRADGPRPPRHYIPVKREPFQVKPESATGRPRAEEPDLKQLRDRLLDLGRALERNKQAVKDRIRVEQARPLSPDLLRIMQLLINEYELELYNQNAARLVILMSEL